MLSTQTKKFRPPADKNAWLDDCIKRLYDLKGKTEENVVCKFKMDEVVYILQLVSELFLEENNLLEAEPPIKVVGDLHAQYQDFHRLLDLVGRVPDEKLMFLGDYVDRGPQGIEILLLLFCWKLRYPSRCYVLRGNHETPSVNRIYGFYNEVVWKYGLGLWWDFQYCFNRIPMVGLIAKKIMCMHGGLSPEVNSLDDIRNIERPCEPLDRGMLMDLLWADPTNQGEGWFYSMRGVSYAFGVGALNEKLKLLGVEMIIRAHQVAQDGYEVMAGRRLITVFSVPNYCEQFSNAAAVVCVDTDLRISFQQLPPAPLPAGKLTKMQVAPPIALNPDEAAAAADKKWFSAYNSKASGGASLKDLPAITVSPITAPSPAAEEKSVSSKQPKVDEDNSAPSTNPPPTSPNASRSR